MNYPKPKTLKYDLALASKYLLVPNTCLKIKFVAPKSTGIFGLNEDVEYDPFPDFIDSNQSPTRKTIKFWLLFIFAVCFMGILLPFILKRLRSR